MAPRALIHYFYSDSGAIPKCFKEEWPWRRSASGLDQPDESLSLRSKSQIWYFIHLKVHKAKRGSFEVLILILIMPSIEWTGYLPYQLSNRRVLFGTWMGTRIGLNKIFVGLLFPRIYGVRHRFLKKINSIDCTMDPPEKALARV